MRNFLKTKGLKNKKKLKKTKRNKKTNRTKKTKKTKKTRKFIKMSGGVIREALTYIMSRFSKESEPKPEPKPEPIVEPEPIPELIVEPIHEPIIEPVPEQVVEPTPEPTPEPIKVNTINGDPIYRINIEGCDYYFFGNNNRYVLVLIGDKSYIYKLDKDTPDLPERFRKTNFVEKKKLNVEYLINTLAKYNVFYFEHGKCPTANLILKDAQKKLSELNDSLQTKCSNLSLHLDYVYKHKTDSTLELYDDLKKNYSVGPYLLVLCLYYDNHCISSITIKINGIELSIDSRTHTDYERRKYNILLCSIIIILSKHISKDIKYIISIAINQVSAYIMMQYFGGKLHYNPYDDGENENEREFLKFSEEKGMPLHAPNTNYKRLFDLYTDKFKKLTIAVTVNPENIEKADTKFNDLVRGISQITCPEVFTN
jgi:Mor family transcriptional regulator